VVIHPSLSETYSIVVAEASLLNKPVLVKNANYVKINEHIDHVCHIYKDTTDALRYILNAFGNTIGNKDYQWAKDNLDYNKCMNELNNNIKRLMK
jgi:hypothetical protein